MTVTHHTPFAMPTNTATQRVAVFGDTHGEFPLITEALRYGRDHADHTILLGDLFDRGSQDARSLKLYLKWFMERPAHITILPGNHEQMLFAALTSDHPQWGELVGIPQNGCGWWTKYILQYRLNANDDSIEAMRREARLCVLHALVHDTGMDRDTAIHWLDTVTQAWVDDQQALYAQYGHTLIVHAGVCPNARDPIAWIRDHAMIHDDTAYSPLWIRHPFLTHRDGFGDAGYTVVHGHTPCDDPGPQPDTHRINLDGKAYRTKRLHGILLEPGQGTMLTVSP